MQKKKSKPTHKKKQVKLIPKTILKKKSSKPTIAEKFLIVCGEPSGDLLGANLIDEFNKTKRNFSFMGIGGIEMDKTGFSSLYDMESLSVIGFTGIVTKYNHLKKIAKDLVQKSVEQNVKYAILIDYPGFNLHLAEKLREKGIKIIFYVSPQIWAWRFKRIFRIKECVNLMLVLFPFEKKIYDEYKVNCEFVGHPLRSRMEEKRNTEKPISLKKGITTICLMPGSRTGEITKLLDPILDSVVLIRDEMIRQNKSVQFVLPNINKSQEQFILERLKKVNEEFNIKIEYLFDNSAKSLEICDLVILSSGTATLEVAYFEKPMIIIYKLSFISYHIGIRLIKTKDIGLVNILAGERICPELWQQDANGKNIFQESMRILDDKIYRLEMIKKIKAVKTSLGDGNAGKNSTNAILKLIRESASL